MEPQDVSLFLFPLPPARGFPLFYGNVTFPFFTYWRTKERNVQRFSLSPHFAHAPNHPPPRPDPRPDSRCCREAGVARGGR